MLVHCAVNYNNICNLGIFQLRRKVESLRCLQRTSRRLLCSVSEYFLSWQSCRVKIRSGISPSEKPKCKTVYT